MVRSGERGLSPFARDKLLLDVYESCRHRKTAISDAAALADLIVAELLRLKHGGLLERSQVVRTTHRLLERFDKTAATVYAAYHPTS